MSDVSNSVAPVGVAATAPPVAVLVPPVAVRVATPAEKSVFGPDVRFDASGNPIEAGIGALIADAKAAFQKVEDFVASLDPAKPSIIAPWTVVTPASVESPAAATLIPVPPVLPSVTVATAAGVPPSVTVATAAGVPPSVTVATAAGVAAVKAAIATAPRANRADMIAKLKALEAELAASAD